MEAPSQEQLKQQISDYYKTTLSSGLRCEVKSLSMAEVEETGGKNITATVRFIHNASGQGEDSKVQIPCDGKGNLDWTNTKFLDEDEPHTVDPSKTSHPEVKSPEPLPANNQKPKDGGGGQPPEKGKYIQPPKKVGAQGGKKVKAGEAKKAIKPPKRYGTDELGWPTADQLELEEQQEEQRQVAMREGYVHGQDDWGVDESAGTPVDAGDDFDVFTEAGISPAMVQQAAASRLGEDLTSPEGYVHGQDSLEENMQGIKPVALKGEDIPVALVEYRAKSLVEGTDTTLFEFGVLFESEAVRDEAKTAVESMDGVEDVELLEDVGIAVVCRKDESVDNPAAPLAVISESLGLNMIWDDGEKDRFHQDLKEMSKDTHNYTDNKGQYHTGVQTSANDPAAPGLSGDQQKPTGEEGGPKKRKHAKTSGDQGGDGLGGAKSASAPSVGPDGKESTKQAGQQAESLKEQDFLDDVMAYDDDDAAGDEPVDDEYDAEGEALDDTIMSLVAAQAELGLEVVLQVAREHYEGMGQELSPEQEQQIKDTFAEFAQESGGEAEAEVEVTSVEIDTNQEPGDEENANPFESQQEDVNINVNDGGSAEVTASDNAEPAVEPAAEPAPEAAPSTETPAEEPSEKPDEDNETEQKDDDDKEPSEKPDAEEALSILRNDLVDELTEMEEFDAVLEIESLEVDDLLALDEALPPPGEGGRFKKLKKELKGKGAEDPGALASYIGRKKYGKGKFQQMAAAGESKKEEKPKVNEEDAALVGQNSTTTGWAADQPAPNQPLSFVGNDAYSFAQHIAVKDPQVRTAKVLKPGKFSRTTSRHANMVANRLAKHGYQVDRVDSFEDDPAMKVGELDNSMSLGLPEESLIQLSSTRFKKEAIEKLTDEQKSQIKEKLIARGKKLAEDQQNQNTYGGTQTIQRVRGKDKNYNMFGRLKPGVKWKGLVRVVWDDGNESWEKPGDITNVGPNPYNVKGPSGGPTKPGSNKMTQKGGEEYDMLKSLESIKKLPHEKRFDKAVELQLEGKKIDLDKLVPLLTEGMDEFDQFDSGKLVESLLPSKPTTTKEPEPTQEITEDEDEDSGTITMLTEDYYGVEKTVVIDDLEEDSA